MFPSDHFKGHTGDRPDSSKEWQFIWEEVPVVDREWTRPLGDLFESWNWDGVESDGAGEENQRRREQVATLKASAFHR